MIAMPINFTDIPLEKEYVGEGKYCVTAVSFLTQDGIVVLIFGGEKPHVGAVAVGIPRPSLRNHRKMSATSSVFTLVGHKDDRIARPVAEKLAKRLKEVVIVIAGVHVEGATREDIKILVNNSNEAVNKLMKKLRRKMTRK